MKHEEVEILLVEDNMHDAEMTTRALRKNNIVQSIYHVKDGAEALDFLFAKGQYSNRDIKNTPKIILLDLRMPKVDGIQVLTKVKAAAETKHIPVIVLTSSKEDPNMEVCIGLGAANFIVKPVNLEGFIRVLAELKMYWPALDN